MLEVDANGTCIMELMHRVARCATSIEILWESSGYWHLRR